MPEEDDPDSMAAGEADDPESANANEPEDPESANADEQTDPESTNAGEADDPFDRRVAPYSGETTADVDPVEPPERGDGETIEPDLPESAIGEAERLTRLARRVPDDAEAESYRERRADLLAEHDYAAVIRDDGGDQTLVCHPIEWRDGEGAIDPALIDEIDRAAEVPLGGAGDPEAWDAVAEKNEAVVEDVRAAHGEVHAANAEAFAEYVSNHHAKPIAAVTADELAWFREEYYPRNVWPSDEQRTALDRSLELVYAELDVPMPKQAAGGEEGDGEEGDGEEGDGEEGEREGK